jgi:diguanylate cyclase (GGDEF)-like protein
MLFDIDHFKVINDRLGHGAGDAALVTLAERATEMFRGMGELGRWGGDEFVALVRNVDPEDASRMADALCVHVASEPLPGGAPMTISCGVTAVRRGDSTDSLLQRADAALYAAKRAGSNRVESIVELDEGLFLILFCKNYKRSLCMRAAKRGSPRRESQRWSTRRKVMRTSRAA